MQIKWTDMHWKGIENDIVIGDEHCTKQFVHYLAEDFPHEDDSVGGIKSFFVSC